MYDVPAVYDLLHRQGLTPQKLMRRAYERDDQKIAEWKTKPTPRSKKILKKKVPRSFGLMKLLPFRWYFIKNVGFKAQTPAVKTSGRRQGINAISVLSNTGEFWYRVYIELFIDDVFIDCLKDLISRQKRLIYIITDGNQGHNSKKVRDIIARLAGRLSILPCHLMPTIPIRWTGVELYPATPNGMNAT